MKAHAEQVICETDELSQKVREVIEILQHHMKNGELQVGWNNT